MTRSNPMLAAALRHAEAGLHIFPVYSTDEAGMCSCPKTASCKSPGKHPLTMNGHSDATTDAARIIGWWRAWPHANIGIATGASGLVVVDVDGKDGRAGPENWRRLVDELGTELEDTTMVDTASGTGFHVYFLAGAHKIKSVNGALGEGIDVKAWGGYVVAPGSAIAGRAYIFKDGHGFEHLTALPPSLAERLEAAGDARGRGGGHDEPGRPIPAGERNATLTSIAGKMRWEGSGRDEIGAALHRINAERCDPALPGDEVHRIADSVAKYPRGRGSLSLGDLTDTGNAELFARQHASRVRFVSTLGWLVYDEALGRYERDSGREVQLAMQTARSRFEQAAAGGDEKAAAVLAKWAGRSLSRKLLSDALRLAETIPDLRTGVDAFDPDPMLLNARNGVLDLATGRLLPHSPSHMMTKVAGADYDPDARCELWRAHLDRILAGDEAMIAFLQRLCGYALTGLSGEQKFAILYGSGANGKTVTVEALRAVLGEYAETADFKTFSVTGSSGPRNDLAKLVGTRLVTTAETSSGQKLDEAVIKQVTGGDAISVRFMYHEFFTYVPQYTVFLSSNHLPSIEGIDKGLWRRIFLIPFTVSIPEPEQDEAMQKKLRAELPGILAWMVEGCRAWQERGFDPPLSVQLATAEYHDAVDLIGQFIAEHLVPDPDAWVELKDLYGRYTSWCTTNGYSALSAQQLSSRLRDHGLTLTKDAPRTHRSRIRGHKLVSVSRGEEQTIVF
jgi:putative DNA primase/helicase